MKSKRERGFTLVELTVGVAVMALIGAAIFSVLSSSLRAYQFGSNDERAFAEARAALSAIAEELRYQADVTGPAAGTADAAQISYIRDGEAHSIILGAGAEAGNLVIVTPGGRQLVGGGLIRAATFSRDGTHPQRITVRVTAGQNPAVAASAAITLDMVVWFGTI